MEILDSEANIFPRIHKTNYVFTHTTFSQAHMDINNEDSFVQCIDCKSRISRGAKKCVKCGAFQNNLKSHLIYLAQVAGFLAIFSSALVYVVNSLPEIREYFWWKESIEVLSLNRGSVVFSNTGDGDLFIKAIEFIRPMPDGGADTQTHSINKLIRKGDIVKVLFLHDSSANGVRHLKTVAGGASPETRDWIAIANHAISDGTCFLISHYESDNASYLQAIKHYERTGVVGPMTIPHRATIHAYSMAERRMLSVPFEIVSMVHQIDSPECEMPNNLILQTPKIGAAEGESYE